MFVLVQLPFADARCFVARAERLLKPPWPLVEPDRDFVRAVGQVRERRRGGVTPWVGEEVYCDARRALRIEPDDRVGRRGRCRFRRYLSDGKALTRIEVGISLRSIPSHGGLAHLPGAIHSSQPQTTHGDAPGTVPELLARALSLSFRTPAPEGSVNGNLFGLRAPLARHLLRSTTRLLADEPFHEEAWWLQPTPPLVIGECRAHEGLTPPRGAHRVPIAEEHGISLYTFTVALSNTTAKIWLLSTDRSASRDTLRRLRIHLLRFHADRMTLRHILRLLALGRLDTNRGSEAFDRLQHYLLATFRGLDLRRSHGFTQETILDAAYSADAFVSDSERNTILDQLKEARLNILRNVERGLSRDSPAISLPTYNIVNMNVDGSVFYRDQYNVTGQAGAVGPNARVDSARFEQIWHGLADELDLDRLRGELESLSQELSARRLTTADDRAILDIAQAAHAAEQGDGPGMLVYLARTGQWVLSTAKDIGVDLVAAVMKELMIS
jgi:hypothetical protein